MRIEDCEMYTAADNRGMSIRENLAELMRQRRMNPHSLAAATGVKQPTIYRILEGESLTPRDATLQPLASYFGVSIEQLRYGQAMGVANVSEHGVPEAAPGERVAPVISWVQAGEWCEASDPYPAGYSDEWERVPDQAGKHAIWLRVVGDSMTAPSGLSIPEGMLILVDPDYPAISGRLVVAKLTDSQQVTFKRLVEDAGRRYLKPLNPAYPMVEINGNCRIIGTVREAKVKL